MVAEGAELNPAIETTLMLGIRVRIRTDYNFDDHTRVLSFSAMGPSIRAVTAESAYTILDETGARLLSPTRSMLFGTSCFL